MAINKTAGNAKGEKMIARRLEKEFNVTDALFQDLRNQTLDYGDISIVFSIASEMPRSTAGAKIRKVMILGMARATTGMGKSAKKNRN